MNTRRTAPPELLGREAERAGIDARLQDARAGHSSALVVCGEAGIGKSTLLRYAVAHADGMAVLSAAGVESEAALPFAALADFLRPALGHLHALPEPQAAALAGALALGPPVGADRFAACAATMGLLASFAEAGPVVGVIDEAQWLDPSSLEALLFTARRIDAEGIALFFAVRDDEGGSLAQAGLEELPLSGRGGREAQELISRAVEPQPSPDLVERLVRATGGNPLALLEIPALLSDAQLTGEEPLEDLPLTPSIERALLGRVAALRDQTRRALVVARASGHRELQAGGAPGHSPAVGDARARGARERSRRARRRRGGRRDPDRERADRVPARTPSLGDLPCGAGGSPPIRAPRARGDDGRERRGAEVCLASRRRGAEPGRGDRRRA